MRRRRSLVALAVLAVLAAVASGCGPAVVAVPPSAEAADVVRIDDPETGVSFEMPGTPRERSDTERVADLGRIETKRWDLEGAGQSAYFGAGAVRFPTQMTWDARTRSRMLDAYVQTMVGAAHGRLQGLSRARRGEQHEARFRIRLENGASLRARVVVGVHGIAFALFGAQPNTGWERAGQRLLASLALRDA